MFSQSSNRLFISLLIVMVGMLTGTILLFARVNGTLNTPWLLVTAPMLLSLALLIFESHMASKD